MKIFPKAIPPNPYSVSLGFYLNDISTAVSHSYTKINGNNNYINFASHLRVFSTKFLKEYLSNLQASEWVNERNAIHLALEPKHLEICSIWNLLQNKLALTVRRDRPVTRVREQRQSKLYYREDIILKVSARLYYTNRPWIEELIHETKSSLEPFSQEQQAYFNGNRDFNDIAYENRLISYVSLGWDAVMDTLDAKYNAASDPIIKYGLTIGEQLTAKLLIHLADKSFGK